MTREEIIEFCEMKSQAEPENEDVFNHIIKVLEQQHCGDCWSKKEVVDIINRQRFGIQKISMGIIKEKLEALPTITHPQNWIPVSERLPEDFQRVLVTIINYAGYKVVRVAEYNSGKKTFQIKENNERWKVGEKGLLAWQPLPDPYE